MVVADARFTDGRHLTCRMTKYLTTVHRCFNIMQREALRNTAYERYNGTTQGKGKGATPEKRLDTGRFSPGDRC